MEDFVAATLIMNLLTIFFIFNSRMHASVVKRNNKTSKIYDIIMQHHTLAHRDDRISFTLPKQK